MKDAFDAEEVLQEIDEHQVSLFMGVPTHYHRFLKVAHMNRFSLSSMRLFVSGYPCLRRFLRPLNKNFDILF